LLNLAVPSKHLGNSVIFEFDIWQRRWPTEIASDVMNAFAGLRHLVRLGLVRLGQFG